MLSGRYNTIEWRESEQEASERDIVVCVCVRGGGGKGKKHHANARAHLHVLAQPHKADIVRLGVVRAQKIGGRHSNRGNAARHQRFDHQCVELVHGEAHLRVAHDGVRVEEEAAVDGVLRGGVVAEGAGTCEEDNSGKHILKGPLNSRKGVRSSVRLQLSRNAYCSSTGSSANLPRHGIGWREWARTLLIHSRTSVSQRSAWSLLHPARNAVFEGVAAD